jgi:hypothetical protein
MGNTSISTRVRDEQGHKSVVIFFPVTHPTIFVMIASIMKLVRVIFLPLLLAFALLFAQQVGAAHALHHALEDLAQQQNDKQSSHSSTCEQCAAYAQLGSALNVGAHNLTLLHVSDERVQYRTVLFRSIRSLPAVARGPPQTKRIA